MRTVRHAGKINVFISGGIFPWNWKSNWDTRGERQVSVKRWHFCFLLRCSVCVCNAVNLSSEWIDEDEILALGEAKHEMIRKLCWHSQFVSRSWLFLRSLQLTPTHTFTQRKKSGSLRSSWQPSNHWQKSRKRERKNKYSRSKVSSWNERENVYCKYFYWLLIDRDDSELLSIKSREKLKGKSLFHLIRWLWMGFLSSLSSVKRTRWDLSQIFNMTTSFHFDCVSCARKLFRAPFFGLWFIVFNKNVINFLSSDFGVSCVRRFSSLPSTLVSMRKQDRLSERQGRTKMLRTRDKVSLVTNSTYTWKCSLKFSASQKIWVHQQKKDWKFQHFLTENFSSFVHLAFLLGIAVHCTINFYDSRSALPAPCASILMMSFRKNVHSEARCVRIKLSEFTS